MDGIAVLAPRLKPATGKPRSRRDPQRDTKRDTTRDTNLDFVKGFLVVVMVLYHALNYFAVVPPEVYGYLRFVNGSFVFMAGFAVALFYDTGAPSPTLMRLVVRGLKLLVLFTVLNLTLATLAVTNYRNVTFGLAAYVSQIERIYGSGEAPQIAFRILVPIAYVLMLAGLFLVSKALQRLLVPLTFFAALLHNAWFNSVPPNVFFVLTGAVGLSLGLLARVLNLRPPMPTPNWPASIAKIAAFLALASMMNRLSSNVLAYSLGLGLMLAAVYSAARSLDPSSALYRATVLLGSYSLVAYVGQSGYLFLLQRALRGQGLTPAAALAVAVLSTCVFLWVGCQCLEALRQRSRWAENTYRMVFA